MDMGDEIRVIEVEVDDASKPLAEIAGAELLRLLDTESIEEQPDVKPVESS